MAYFQSWFNDHRMYLEDMPNCCMTYGDLLGSATECGIYTFTNKPKHLKQYKQNRENIVGFEMKKRICSDCVEGSRGVRNVLRYFWTVPKLTEIRHPLLAGILPNLWLRIHYFYLNPAWLDSKMIFPIENLAKESLLGSGNYGEVYKGVFRQGIAV